MADVKDVKLSMGWLSFKSERCRHINNVPGTLPCFFFFFFPPLVPPHPTPPLPPHLQPFCLSRLHPSAASRNRKCLNFPQTVRYFNGGRVNDYSNGAFLCQRVLLCPSLEMETRSGCPSRRALMFPAERDSRTVTSAGPRL